MKALSLWQPWASLWLTPSKIHETRHWRLQVPTSGFWLAVHAAKRLERDVDWKLDAICYHHFGHHWRRELPRGALLGRVFVTACLPTASLYDPDGGAPAAMSLEDFECGNFAEGRYAFRRSDVHALAIPHAFIGRQGIFSVPDHIFAEAA